MFLLNNKKINIDSQVTYNGITYPNLRDPDVRSLIGVIEVPDPVYPDPDTHFWTENEDGSLTITEKPTEMVAATMLAKAKAARQHQVSEITVTTTSGNIFDGDEDSQNRMVRAISAMDDTDNTQWVLADNTIVSVNKAELKEALKLAGIAMTTIWMQPYL